MERAGKARYDWLSLGLMLLLMCIGLLFVFSATYKPEQPFSLFFKKQLIGMVSGLLIYALIALVPYRQLMRLSFLGYMAVLGLLIFTIIKGSIGMGARRWINLFFFKFQPAELAKLLFPAFLVYYFQSRNERRYYTVRDYVPVIGIMGVSFLLILKQPDLGTGLVFLASGVMLLWLMGLPRKFFIIALCASVIGAPVMWKFLRPYQKQRIIVFLGYGQAHKERYQIEQSVIAVGSGGLFGKGLLKGTQNQLFFLPESRTDFIFAVIAEEWGFLGCLGVILLYLLLFVRLLMRMGAIPSFFYQVLAFGLMFHIMLSMLINIGMVLGLLPIVGIPLPLMSYGISHLWITFASLGWIQGILACRGDMHHA